MINIIKKHTNKTIILFIKGWRYLIRPVFPANQCIFEPTCSIYAEEAVKVHGPIKGVFMGFWRVLRCNPWNRGGYDPVKPDKRKEG